MITAAQQDQLNRISIRWAQAHRRQDLLDWHSLTGWLFSMAGLSYHRSVEFMPVDLSRLPHLICEVA